MNSKSVVSFGRRDLKVIINRFYTYAMICSFVYGIRRTITVEWAWKRRVNESNDEMHIRILVNTADMHSIGLLRFILMELVPMARLRQTPNEQERD